jgi:hypothetical protein
MQKQVSIFVCTIFLCFLNYIPLCAQVFKQWDKTFGGNNDDILNSVCQTPDGGILLGGLSSSAISGDKTTNSKGGSDYWIIKTDKNGNKLWEKGFGGTGDDKLRTIVIMPNGNFLLAGSSNSTTSGDKSANTKGGYDYWLVLIDQNGNKIWDKTLGGSAQDILHSAILLNNGTFLLGGDSNSNQSSDKTQNSKGGNDFWLVNIDENGNKIWDKTLGGSDDDNLRGISAVPSNGYMLVGSSLSTSSGDKTESNKGGTDYWIVRVDQNGNKIWDKTYGGNNNDGAYSVLVTSDEEFLITGDSYSSQSGDKTTTSKGGRDYWIIKTDKNGNKLWEKGFGTDADDNLRTSLKTSDGGFLLVGYSNGSLSEDKTVDGKGGYDYWVLKVNSSGLKLWNQAFGGPNDDYIIAASPMNDDYILGGYSLSGQSNDKSQPNKGGLDYWIISAMPPRNTITGNIFRDDNGNCIINTGEIGLSGITVVAEPGNYYAFTDSIGRYTINLPDTGTYSVRQLIGQDKGRIVEQTCPANQSAQQVRLVTRGDTAKNINFGNRATLCSLLSVSVQSDRRRRCFQNNTVVNYRNDGFAAAAGTKVHLKLPSSVRLLTADKPYTLGKDSVYVFDIGTLAPGKGGSIQIIDSVICVNAVRGLTACTQVWMTPVNNCTVPKNTWDESDIALKGKCIENGRVRFVLANTGKDMTDSSSFRIYLNAQLSLQKNFKLVAGDSLILRIPANGKTVRLEADQRPDHPRKTQSNITLEGCRATVNEVISTGFVNQFPQDDREPEIASDCQMIRDSYDPNDKLVFPTGLTSEHYTPTKAELAYTIRFQNTGTDVAYTVVLVDTLSENLDPATLKLGAASHAYSFSVSGKGRPVLKWTFNKINLPDSSTNQAGSNGFVTFTIKAKTSIGPKTGIANFADIFFDYNDPVRTNTTYNVMYDIPPVVNQATALEAGKVLLNKPILASFSPESGKAGTQVILTGNYLDSTQTKIAVRFGDKTAKIISATPTQLVVEAPANVSTSKITVSNEAGMATSVKEFAITQEPTAIEPRIAAQIKVFPNPSEGAFVVDYSNVSLLIQKIEVVNALGKVVLSYPVDKNNVKSLALRIKGSPGVYWLKFTTPEGSFSKKIVIR